MSDLLFCYLHEDGVFDLAVENSEIQKDESLKTAVLISLFSDARCEKIELPAGEKSQRGFWGDCILGEKTGSKLWLLERAKHTNETLLRAKEYAKKALEWMISDGLAKEISVETSFNFQRKMIINILIFKNNGVVESLDVSNLWNSL